MKYQNKEEHRLFTQTFVLCHELGCSKRRYGFYEFRLVSDDVTNKMFIIVRGMFIR